MSAKRTGKVPKALSKAYENALAAEGAPVALDLLGFGATIGDLVRGKSRKAAKPHAKKKARAKPRKKKAAAKSRRKTKK